MIETKEFGPQPLIKVMERLKVTSQDLVKASKVQLSFKMVAKGCKGRRLTTNAQQKILSAFHALHPEANVTMKQLFNYS